MNWITANYFSESLWIELNASRSARIFIGLLLGLLMRWKMESMNELISTNEKWLRKFGIATAAITVCNRYCMAAPYEYADQKSQRQHFLPCILVNVNLWWSYSTKWIIFFFSLSPFRLYLPGKSKWYNFMFLIDLLNWIVFRTNKQKRGWHLSVFVSVKKSTNVIDIIVVVIRMEFIVTIDI